MKLTHAKNLMIFLTFLFSSQANAFCLRGAEFSGHGNSPGLAETDAEINASHDCEGNAPPNHIVRQSNYSDVRMPDNTWTSRARFQCCFEW